MALSTQQSTAQNSQHSQLCCLPAWGAQCKPSRHTHRQPAVQGCNEADVQQQQQQQQLQNYAPLTFACF